MMRKDAFLCEGGLRFVVKKGEVSGREEELRNSLNPPCVRDVRNPVGRLPPKGRFVSSHMVVGSRAQRAGGCSRGGGGCFGAHGDARRMNALEIGLRNPLALLVPFHTRRAGRP